MRQLLSSAGLFLLVHLASTHAFAGAWTKPEGKGEFILNSVYFSSDGFFDRDGDRQSQQRFNKVELNPYVEFGYSDKLTLGANVFLHYVEQDQTSGTADNIGLGDPELFARYQLWRKDTSVLSLQPLISLPSYYEDNAVPRSGSDSFDVELSALGGHGFEWQSQSHYVEARLGYRHRTDGALDDQLRADIKLGLRIDEDWEFIPAAYSIWAINADKRPIFTEDGQQDFDLVKLEAMLRYNLDETRYLQGGGFAHVYGRNVGDGHGVVLTAGWNF